MIIGITGYKGRLGTQLVSMADCVPIDCDITDKKKLRDVVQSIKPDVIINCAAYTDVDGCELDYKKALTVNSSAVANVRDSFDGKLIHISTDYVFDGISGAASNLKRKHDPFNAYGFSKSGGEIIAWYYKPECENVVVRTTGLYGGISGKHDFSTLILDHLRNKNRIRVTNQLRANQSYIPHVAEAIHKLAYKEAKDHEQTVHVASLDIMSRYEFALLLAMVFGYSDENIIPVSNDAIGWLAERPTHSGLLVDYSVKIGLPIYTIHQGLQEYKNAN